MLTDNKELWNQFYKDYFPEIFNKGLAEGEAKGREEGLEKGLKKGRVEGARSSLLFLLATSRGRPGARLEEKIASVRSLDELNRLLLVAGQPGDLEAFEAEVDKALKAERQ